MRKFVSLGAVAVILVGAWLLNGSHGVPNILQQYVENKEFVTLKPHYTSEQIMEAHKKELLLDNKHSFQDAELKYHPYLLIEDKYVQPDKKSREGTILWSLVDGEMVINTETWEKTHGFEDAINAGASRSDFRLMQAVARQKGLATFDQLQKDLHLEKETLSQWIESALSKQLIVKNGNSIQLHFQDPKILVTPETKMTDWLVKKPYNYSQLVSSKYSPSQLTKVAKAAFGEDFSIRNMTEVFLPVYSIHVTTPDGSTFTSYWNAVNGQKEKYN